MALGESLNEIEKKRSSLVRHLVEMPPAAIYALADKRHLFSGFELCRRQPLSNLSWSDDGTLTVELREGAKSLHISLSFAVDTLSTSCECGLWSPSGCCSHIVATLATLKKAVTSAALPMLKLPEGYLEQIISGLYGDQGGKRALDGGAEESSLTLVLQRDRSGALDFVLSREGEPVSLSDPAVPSQIRHFFRELFNSNYRARWIEDFNARFGGRYPFAFRTDNGALVPLSMAPGSGRRIVIRLDLADDRVTVCRCFEDGSSVEKGSFANDSYHFDLRNGLIERIADAEGVSYFNRFTPLLHSVNASWLKVMEDGFALSRTAFNELRLSLSAEEKIHFLEHAVFMVRGRERRVREVSPQYRINIVEEGPSLRIVAEGVVEGIPFSLSPETFWFFTPEGRSTFPQPLKAKKRIASIIATCFAVVACHSKSERDRELRAAFDSPDFFKRGIKSEARRIVSHFWQTLNERHSLLQAADGEWLEVPVDPVLQARLLEIPCAIFGADALSQGDRVGHLVLPREEGMRQLSRLRRDCAAAGFDLYFQGEPLETVSWSFTVDATHSSIDWFELRPEIRYEGEVIAEQELLEAVQAGGLFRRNGALFLLDDDTTRALALFAAGGKRQVVRIPRLQILDWIVLRKNGVRVILSEADEKIIESLTNFERIEQRTPPAGLTSKLRRYQHEGLNWLAFLYEHRFGACLADDMGLGKTIQAIAFLAAIKEGEIASDLSSPLPHLIVVPPSLIFNWESEIERFYPGLKVLVYRGQGRRAHFEGVDLVLTSYGVVQRDIEELSELRFHVIVFDEAQAVKNIHAETTGAVRRLKGRFKVALTGTPVENHLGEFYSVIDLAVPGLLGPFEPFRRGMAKEGDEFLETLIRRTRPFVLRRSKDMIADELPPKVETDIYLEMTPRQKALYVRTVAHVKATVEEAYRLNSAAQARIISLTAILKLRQICLSTKLLLPEGRDSAPKVEFLIEQLDELFDEGHSVLVFSQFTSFLDIVQDALTAHGTRFSRLDGSTPVSRRKALVEGFQESSEPSVFLLSLKAGGRGLNLTKASYVFHLDPWWNPAVENQASDRAHRIGQKNQVSITRLLMRHTIEEKMMELKKRKLKLYRALLEDSDGDSGVPIGKEDFEFLLSS
ncbi:DEAD/DEAH box helicase [Geomonas sp. RF6]|uniref:DEAD/DEAH box helicase n=1 Tax=Geomonas sp. RF6 TaxID=2897342 RepID=UPI001E417F92|nr:DEAD/DEAH box helicase [Geomonas sp. RF6]UFS72874.1 DEAD/DEAH box helicase [Geomonas sp. RF6]